MRFSRRRFLAAGLSASATLALPGAVESVLAAVTRGPRLETRGYGPLIPDPEGVLDLPAGFTYRALSTAILRTDSDPRWSQKLTDGTPVPPLHDGMGSFRGKDGGTILVRNHELRPGDTPVLDPGRVRPYDELGAGGTTTLWVDAERRVQRAFASLSGTFRNCAGGITPWGSWLTAEECVYMPGPRDPHSHDQTPEVSERHGYVFEVDARSETLADPVPIRGMGRFYHEAVAVDPATGDVYLSEDRDDGLLYRYRPNAAAVSPRLQIGDLAKGGVLEALRIVGRPSATTQNWGAREFLPGVRFTCDWVRIEDPDPEIDQERDPDDDETDPLRKRPRTASGSTRGQGFTLGAAQFARGEGLVHSKGAIYLCCTNGGAQRAGQVWRYEPGHQRLSLVVEPDDRALLDGPDNLVVAPNGDLVICEDGREDDYLVGLTRGGRFYRIARCVPTRTELAGACFSADGNTLFVNIQNPGVTCAIQGPWGARA